MHLFYAPEISSSFVTLSVEESVHCLKSLRHKKGDKVLVSSGKGKVYISEIFDAIPGQCVLKILDQYSQPHDFPLITLAVSPVKNPDRLEWLIEKATEMGFSVFQPYISSHSEKSKINLQRLEKISIAALKQSQGAFLPVLQNTVTFHELVQQDFSGQKFIATCLTFEKKPLLKHVYKPGNKAMLIIGPEGDFNEEEIHLAQQNGFLPVSLGQSRLRTETAALVALFTIHFVNE